jgi:hypothetical protein
MRGRNELCRVCVPLACGQGRWLQRTSASSACPTPLCRIPNAASETDTQRIDRGRHAGKGSSSSIQCEHVLTDVGGESWAVFTEHALDTCLELGGGQARVSFACDHETLESRRHYEAGGLGPDVGALRPDTQLVHVGPQRLQRLEGQRQRQQHMLQHLPIAMAHHRA